MNSSKTLSLFSPFKQVFCIPVRHRYYADKIKNGPIVKDYGYKEKIFTGGLLPRLKDAERLKTPIYCPKSAWNPKLALEGQNDYIDILGGQKLKPHDVKYDIPKWLRGRKGNEFQLLLLKQKTFNHTHYVTDFPSAWYNLSRRVKYLYKYLNWKTKTKFMKS